MKIFRLLTVFLLAFVHVAFAEETPSLEEALRRVAEEIADHGQESPDASLQGAQQSVYRSEGLAAMIQLWKAGKQWPAELAWWRSPYPNARKLAIALFYTSYTDIDVPQVPRFEEESNRFDKAESEQRKKEIAEVLEHLPEIKKQLEGLLEKK